MRLKIVTLLLLYSFLLPSLLSAAPDPNRQTISKEIANQVLTDGVLTIDWVIHYENTSAGVLGNVVIQDNFSSNQTLLGSPSTPNNWGYGFSSNSFSPMTQNYLGNDFTQPFPNINNQTSFVLTNQFDASSNWCANPTPTWSYTQFRITNMRASDFDSLIVEFLDPDTGNVIRTNDITGTLSHSQGLFTAPFVAGESISYRITGMFSSGVTDYTTVPQISIGVDGPPIQMCYETTVNCPNTAPVSNHVAVGLVAGSGEPLIEIDNEVNVVADVLTSCTNYLSPDPTAPTSVESIPTLSEWAILLLLLSLFGISHILRFR